MTLFLKESTPQKKAKIPIKARGTMKGFQVLFTNLRSPRGVNINEKRQGVGRSLDDVFSAMHREAMQMHQIVNGGFLW